MGTGRNPILILILNFIVGALVTHGLIDPMIQDDVVSGAAEIIGLLIVAGTSAVSLWHLIHQRKLESKVTLQQTQVTQTTTTTPVVEQPQNVPDTFRG